MVNWIKSTVITNDHWNVQLHSLKVQTSTPITFFAGQFTRLALDIDGERVARAYSFVNAPHEAALEFYLIRVSDGVLSGHLHDLQSGDTLWVADKATGFLTMEEVPSGRDIWLMASGTGIGPFLSLMKSLQIWQRFRNIVLIHAVRHVEELTYRLLIEDYLARYPQRFLYIPFVSREDCDFALSGRIPRAIADGRLEERSRLELNPRYSQVMLCGNPDMLKDSTEALQKKGLKRHRRRDPGQITMEKYW